jgi:predicted thioesterase
MDISEEMLDLAKAYVDSGAVSVGYQDDAIHVAAATISRVWAVVSWNFKHLVNIRRENIFNSVNVLHGYPSIRIISPLEVIEDETADSMD